MKKEGAPGGQSGVVVVGTYGSNGVTTERTTGRIMKKAHHDGSGHHFLHEVEGTISRALVPADQNKAFDTMALVREIIDEGSGARLSWLWRPRELLPN